MVKFIIIRHGYSQFNKEGRFTGQLDTPLDYSSDKHLNEFATKPPLIL